MCHSVVLMAPLFRSNVREMGWFVGKFYVSCPFYLKSTFYISNPKVSDCDNKVTA